MIQQLASRFKIMDCLKRINVQELGIHHFYHQIIQIEKNVHIDDCQFKINLGDQLVQLKL